MQSPYKDQPKENWLAITQKLLAQNPLEQDTFVKIVLEAWDCIFSSDICGLRIGKDILPNPQMLGYFIETLTAHRLAKAFPTVWKHGIAKNEKDIVCLTDDKFSFEMKASSSDGKIYANRSYAQEQSENAEKDKNGYYVAINFEKFDEHNLQERPEITLIRLAYLEHTDWKAQKASTGQQASLPAEVYKHKFVTIYAKPLSETN
ncbi:MAG: ScaI family restriction endonuclease [Bacteroidetes bacterium]|nr:MAG: ScaI family restriction endonuclease [Bacteroidota bacterium]